MKALWTKNVRVTSRVPGHGSGSDAPVLQYAPASHTLHAVAPSASWYLPATHLLQLRCRSSALYVPAAQSVALALPTGQKVPLVHVMQSASLVITESVRSIFVPAGHGSGTDAP